MIENLIDVIFNEIEKLIDVEKEKIIFHKETNEYNIFIYKKNNYLENPFINFELHFDSLNHFDCFIYKQPKKKTILYEEVKSYTITLSYNKEGSLKKSKENGCISLKDFIDIIKDLLNEYKRFENE